MNIEVIITAIMVGALLMYGDPSLLDLIMELK